MLKRLFQKTPNLCQRHDTKRFPHIIANELCQSCEKEMCYMCGNHHIESGCCVAISPLSVQAGVFKVQEQSAAQQEKCLSELNNGSLVHVTISKLQCICGKPADAHTAICASCGNATCSEECHDKLVQDHQCNFNQNFVEKVPSMRSILVRNAYYLFDKGYSQGTVFSRSSPHFIAAFLAGNREEFYIQRGYRQYGNPLKQTLQAFNLLKDQGQLDKTVNLYRVCQCSCSNCVQLGYHPVISCSKFCHNDQIFAQRSWAQEQPLEAEKVCDCRCTFCTSGMTVTSHKKLDCKCDCVNKS